MAGCNKVQLSLTTIVAIVIILATSQDTEARVRRSVRRSICARTTYPSLCRPLVKGPNPRRATHSTIVALEAKTKLAIKNAARYTRGNAAISTCCMTLRDATFNLVKARKSLRKRNVMLLKTFLTAAVSDYGVCVNGFIETRQVNTVQNTAVELRKIATNGLLLATLIRTRKN